MPGGESEKVCLVEERLVKGPHKPRLIWSRLQVYAVRNWRFDYALCIKSGPVLSVCSDPSRAPPPRRRRTPTLVSAYLGRFSTSLLQHTGILRFSPSLSLGRRHLGASRDWREGVAGTPGAGLAAA